MLLNQEKLFTTVTDRTRDRIYAAPLEEIVDFRFNSEVAGVFPDMIRRSVPGYDTLIALIGMLAGEYAQAGSVCYDLGCSVGAATLSMANRIHQSDCRILAVDNSMDMLDRCRQNLHASSPSVPIDLVCSDLRDIPVSAASVVVLNFTLQFVPLSERGQVIRDIYEGMNEGGILLISEKIVFDNHVINERMTELHHVFKRANGYSELEIAQKRTALEKVLLPETADTHLARLAEAGFRDCHTYLQCLNFMSFMAIK